MRPVPLLVATTNPGKVREIRQLLAGLPLTLVGLADLEPIPEPDETGETFAENARLKAAYYAAAFGLTTVGEDSGLEIDALGGRPGVRSARYPGATYADKFLNLYAELAAHPRPWAARYVSAVAVARGQGPMAQDELPSLASGPEPWAFECLGTVDGEIAPVPRGTNGFGYDPIFFYPPYGTTFGDVGDDRKLAVAHRGAAFRKVAAWLRERLRLADERQE